MTTLLDDHHAAAGGASSGPSSDAASLVSLLARFAACEVNDLSVPELDEMITVTSRGVSWVQGLRVRASAQRAKLVEAGKAKPSSDSKGGSKPEPDEKPLPKPGGSRHEQARDADAARAVRWAPSFGDALERGLISLDHVAALGRVRNHAPVAAHETALLNVAKMRTAEDFVKWLLLWDAARDGDAGIDRAKRQRARRRAGFGRDSEGLATMFAALSVLDATKVENTLRRIANELFHASGDDGTTLAQRLADALVILADHFNGGGETTKPTRPTLVVICNEDSLRGRLENAGLGYTLSGEPVPAAELRRLACNADILPAVMGGAGQILDFGRIRRTATDPQRLALLTMYGGCIIDGCACPTEFTESHHLTPYEHGGRTDLANLAPLCGADHTRSHTEKWVYTSDPNGHLTVNTRHGTEIPTRKPRRPGNDREPPPAPPGALFPMN